MTRYNFYQRGGTGRTAAVSTRAAQTGTARASAYPGYLISVGSSGEYVRQIQRCLNNVSSRYPSIGRISEDGVFGQATRNAVIAFQQAAGLKADGIVGSATWNRLSQECGGQSGGSGGSTDYPGYVLTVGSTGSAVTRVQQSLNTIYSGTSSVPRLAEDGIFGNATRSVVMLFQRQNGLYPDGIVGPATWAKIMSAVNTGGGTPGGGTPGSGGGTPGGGTGSLSADEAEVLNLINQQRAAYGLSALQIDPAVQNVARIKAQDMADNNYFSHTSPTYGSPFQMLNQFGVSYSSAAENIAANSSNSGAVNAWMNSSGHRANILSGAYGYTGIGVVSDPVYGKKYVQMFIGK